MGAPDGCPRAARAIRRRSFQAHVDACLPGYARPLFVRVLPELEVTSTFKLKKAELGAQGFDPQRIADPLYFRHAQSAAYVPLTPSCSTRCAPVSCVCRGFRLAWVCVRSARRSHSRRHSLPLAELVTVAIRCVAPYAGDRVQQAMHLARFGQAA